MACECAIVPLMLSDAVWRVLRCPACAGRLSRDAVTATCEACGELYAPTSSEALDLRLRSPRKVSLEFTVGEHLPAPPDLDYGALGFNASPAVNFDDMDVPKHLSRQLMSYFPRASGLESLALDLGAGPLSQRLVCERAGFEYVSLDYGDEKVAILGDAHSLPFADESFEFVLSIAVLEHIRYPFVATREVTRVLKPGGMFIGTVAFLEPFHADSFYHHTHLGTLNSLRFAGLDVHRVAPTAGWTVLQAQASNALFPLVPRAVALGIVRPAELAHRLLWRARALARGRSQERERLIGTAGAFEFVASRPQRR